MAKPTNSGIGTGTSDTTGGTQSGSAAHGPNGTLTNQDIDDIKQQAQNLTKLLNDNQITQDEYTELSKEIAKAYGISTLQYVKIKNGKYQTQKYQTQEQSDSATDGAAPPEYLTSSWKAYAASGANQQTQASHPSYPKTYKGVQDQFGVSHSDAKDFKNAMYENGIGGFTKGWDAVIRAYQHGATKEEILKMPKTKDAIKYNFAGSEDSYFAALKKKAGDCERLIDAGAKWDGGELFRGFKHLDQQTLQALTTVGGGLVNLNYGSASWSTDEGVAEGFASHYGGLIAHCTGKRRGHEHQSHFGVRVRARGAVLKAGGVRMYEGRDDKWSDSRVVRPSERRP